MRRFEICHQSSRLTIIYDYAHHLMAFQVALRTVRTVWPSALLFCIICLRQYHRTYRLLEEFSQIFAQADYCAVAPICPGLGDTPETILSIAPSDLAREITACGCPAAGYDTVTDLLEALVIRVNNTQPQRKKIVLVIGSGEGDQIVASICRSVA